MLTRRSFLYTIAAGAAFLVPSGPELQIVRLPGVDFVQRNSPTSRKYLLETMCGGVALLDYNNDGLLDIFFVNGGYLADPVKLAARFSRSETFERPGARRSRRARR